MLEYVVTVESAIIGVFIYWNIIRKFRLMLRRCCMCDDRIGTSDYVEEDDKYLYHFDCWQVLQRGEQYGK